MSGRVQLQFLCIVWFVDACVLLFYNHISRLTELIYLYIISLEAPKNNFMKTDLLQSFYNFFYKTVICPGLSLFILMLIDLMFLVFTKVLILF